MIEMEQGPEWLEIKLNFHVTCLANSPTLLLIVYVYVYVLNKVHYQFFSSLTFMFGMLINRQIYELIKVLFMATFLGTFTGCCSHFHFI